MKPFRLFRPTIANKLFFLTVNAVIGIALMTAFLLYQERNLILQERQDSVRSAVETASSVLEHYDAQVKNNEVSLEEAQQRAKNAISKIRYGAGEYFWINDMTPKMIMHPIKPDLDNTSLADNKDPTGKRLFIEMVDVVKKNSAGAVFYMWPKPSSDAPVQKVSYVKGFAPWGWIIGSGVYLDAIDAAVWQQTKYATLIAVTIGGILLVIGLAVARSVTKPIGEAVKVAQQVASGDLTSQIKTTAKDETGQLMQALKEMNEKLALIVRDVHDGTDAIATASSQIAAGNFDLSSRTEAQAGSLEETASAMEQLTATVRHNADHARQANDLAESAAEVAAKGGQVVSQVVDTMASINASAKRVSDITSVIDGIAFQTNILALNAAVEAARAGDQGRGFAVVAGEVRSLAQRSADAAKEIRALIDESVHQADTGSHLVKEAGATMEQIVSSVEQVHDIMMEISAASIEQSQGIEQVTQAIGQMDQVTQQNAALVEEAAAAAGSLQEQAGHLRELVSVFRITAEVPLRLQLTSAR